MGSIFTFLLFVVQCTDNVRVAVCAAVRTPPPGEIQTWKAKSTKKTKHGRVGTSHGEGGYVPKNMRPTTCGRTE